MLRTPEEYIDRLKSRRPNIYVQGEKLDDPLSHPVVEPIVKSTSLTFEMAKDPEYEDLMTVESPYINEKVNRYNHPHLTSDDYKNMQKMMRVIARKHGSCVGARCVGLNPISVLVDMTGKMDKKYDTNYSDRYTSWLKSIQKEDLAVGGVFTDPKGDRLKRPVEQEDPNQYLHVVDRNEDGIIVRGAKVHLSGVHVSDVALVAPCVRITDENYAIAFATPVDAEGISFHTQLSIPLMSRMADADPYDLGNPVHGGYGISTMIFDDVFIPKEKVFLDGETREASLLAARCGTNHRARMPACKCGICDLLQGAALRSAECIGVDEEDHIQNKLSKMMFVSEQAYGSAIAAADLGSEGKYEGYFSDPKMSSVAKVRCSEALMENIHLATDIAGGVVSGTVTKEDLDSSEHGELLKGFYTGKPDTTAEERVRMAKLIEYVSQGSAVYTESLQGGTPRQGNYMNIRRFTDFEQLKEDAENITKGNLP